MAAAARDRTPRRSRPQPPRPLEARRPLGRGHGPAPRRPRPAPPCPCPVRGNAPHRWAWGPSLTFGSHLPCAACKGEPQRRRGAEIRRQRNTPHDCHAEFLARAQLAPSRPSQWRRAVELPRLGLSAPLRLCGSPSFLRWAWGPSPEFATSAGRTGPAILPQPSAFIRVHPRLDLCPPAGHGVHRSELMILRRRPT